jgi:hypothetical protein
MNTTITLQQAIAELFPQSYNTESWETLLRRFLDHHITQYAQQVNGYQQALATWQQTDQQTPEPTYPIYPVVFGEACEELARQESLDFRALAICLYVSQEQIRYYKQRSEQLEQLCQQFDETSTSLHQAYLSLRRATLDKRLN